MAGQDLPPAGHSSSLVPLVRQRDLHADELAPVLAGLVPSGNLDPLAAPVAVALPVRLRRLVLVVVREQRRAVGIIEVAHDACFGVGLNPGSMYSAKASSMNRSLCRSEDPS